MNIHKTTKQGFTLIELLIVVAIIAILAAIAVPNFLEAQTRSKVTRVKAELRTIALALGCYAIDNNKFPPKWGQDGTGNAYFPDLLTTPIGYLKSWNVVDIFRKVLTTDTPETRVYMFSNYMAGSPYAPWDHPPYSVDPMGTRRNSYCVSSWGPDLLYNSIDWSGPYGMYPINPSASDGVQGHPTVNLPGPNVVPIYDPTNGTVSFGDIPRYGP